MKTTIAIIAVILMTALPALLQGRFMNRWGEPPNLNAAANRLKQFPREVSIWRNEIDQSPLSDEVCQELGLEEHFHRQYRRANSTGHLEVLLMVGPPGRLVRHPPSVCYANRANRQVGEAFSLEIVTKSGKHDFQVLRFRKTSGPVQSEFWVAYAYAAEGGTWSTPSSPRMAYGAVPVLYKLQVLVEVRDEPTKEELQGFLEEFVEAFPVVLSDTPTVGASGKTSPEDL